MEEVGTIKREKSNGGPRGALDEPPPPEVGRPPSVGAQAGVVPTERLNAAIERAQQWLLDTQAPDGYWVGELEGDTILESEYMLLLHFLGRGDDERIPALCRRILGKQLPDGMWAIYPGGPGEVSASIKAYFVLKLAGHAPDAPHMRRAREAILSHGGVTAANSFTKIYLAMFGQYPWSRVPAIPPEIVLLPKWFYFNIYEISSWSRTILVPLAIIYAFRPRVGVPPGTGIGELFVEGGAPDPTLRWASRLICWRNFFLAVDRLLKLHEASPIRPLRRWALRAAERWTRERLRKSAGLGAIFPPMVNTVMALRSLGYPETDPDVAGQLKELADLEIAEGDTLRLQPCVSPVWDTAITAIALHESGMPDDHPALRRAGEWLLSKEVRERGDWSAKRPKLEPGGWYFEFANEFYPDVDDTAMVLMALQRIGLPEGSGKGKVMDRALRWMLGMQGKDGGWASFDVDNRRMCFAQISFADHNAMLDPSTADITARVLEMLGTSELGRSHPAVPPALRYLYHEQEPDGAWYGRWGVNYVYGTWQALRGLESIGEDMGAERARRAVAWLQSTQNADGGWGESCRSYADPSARGRGPSTPSQTAWAVMGLMSAGQTASDAVRRGVQFLLSRQRADGTWDEEEFTGTGFPCVFYLRYHLYRNSFPLMALGMYRRRLAGSRERARNVLSARPADGNGKRRGNGRVRWGA